jgi:uncharacterized protein YjiS (DUF1127 family)
MSVINLFVAGRRAVGEWRRRQRAYAELMALDDRSLADIGVHRSEIPALVAGVGDRRPVREPDAAGPSGWLALLTPRI